MDIHAIMNKGKFCKVSSYGGEYVVQRYALMNHKNDKTYQKWHDDLKKYHKIVHEK